MAVPQVRGEAEPFPSSLMSLLDGNSEVLDALVNEMYARGLSTRDVEDVFTDATGELLISKSAVSGIPTGSGRTTRRSSPAICPRLRPRHSRCKMTNRRTG